MTSIVLQGFYKVLSLCKEQIRHKQLEKPEGMVSRDRHLVRAVELSSRPSRES